MENTKLSSALFAGTHFDRKRFAADFARFRKGPALPSAAAPSAPSPEKKRKRKSGKAKAKKNKKKRAEDAAAASSDVVEGFSVFKGLADNSAELRSGKVDMNTRNDEDSVAVRHRKEIEREIERAAVLRKRFDIHIAGQNAPAPLESFEELISRYGCDSYLVGNLSKLGFQEPTPIQRQAMPILLSGRECFACAPTGSGKTLAFLFPLLMKIKPGSKGGVKAVILCPTRELAAQTVRECKKLVKGRKYYIKLMTKELSKSGNFKDMHCDILVSTPLRLDHAVKKRDLDLSRNAASSLIKQKLIFAGTERGKLLALRQSFQESLNPPVLIFVQSKERAKELYKELAFDDVRVDVIHADLNEQQRQDAVDNLRAGKTWVLIATEVIARGMDFKGVNCVINYDFPESAAAYIHRIGRCGRAGRSGEAITFFTEEDKPFLRNIANVLASSGCEVPSWIMALPKLKRKKHRVDRDPISNLPDED